MNPFKNFPFVLWVVFFCYAICTALLFQKVVLPLIPSLHAGHGLMTNDAAYFDSVASAVAEQIRLHGWSSWQIYPANGARGNVAVLGALYALFGHDPTLIIPVNAAIHALGGLLIFLLARALSDKPSVGIYAGVIAASLFVMFPSALTWYGQNHKDGYAIAGSLLILLTWVRAVMETHTIRSWLALSLIHFLGVVLIGMVRPYNLIVLFAATIGAIGFISCIFLWQRQFKRVATLVIFFMICTITLAMGIKAASVMSVGSKYESITAGIGQLGFTYENWKGSDDWEWREGSFLHGSVEKCIEIAARTRAGLIHYGLSVNAKSMIDEGIQPRSVAEVIFYLPRALQIALLAPFPSSWLANTSMPRLVATGEMFIYYLSLPGLLLLLYYNRKPGVLLVLYFACFFLLAYGFTQANLGTLYRYRYGYLIAVLMLGVLGWSMWLEKTGRWHRLVCLLKKDKQDAFRYPERIETGQQPGRKKAVGTGCWVIGLTFLSYLGFFLRDMMMAKTFGLGASLDYFFIALLIPMFIVNVLCMPLGAAFVPIYLDVGERVSWPAAKIMVPDLSLWITGCLLIFCLFLYLLGPYLIPLFYFKTTSPDIGKLTGLLDIALPILLFSGIVILGNSVLNAHGRAVLTSTAQMIVPIMAIFALLMFGKLYGVKVVMLGMVVGQFLNFLILQFFLKQDNVSLLPNLKSPNLTGFHPLMLQYAPLVVSALFVSLVSPVATLLAISLPEGSVSALNLGTKVVLFITGLLNAAISTVMLPYFSSLVAKNYMMTVRRELSFFLLVATFISVPTSVVLYVLSDPVIGLFFSGGTIDAASTDMVARVMRYALVQLPFFICNALLIRFATATRHVMSIMVVAIVGLLVNITVSMLLMNHMGAPGIALGGSVSVLVSTVLLVIVLVGYFHIRWFDAVIMLLNWLLFITLLVSVHFRSTPSIYVIVSSYLILTIGCFNTMKKENIIEIA